MLCQNCNKNQATVFFKETVNGKMPEYALCPECAKNLKIAGFDEDPLSALFGGFFPRQRAAQSAKKCPSCGAEFRELAASGKLSCPDCYKAFADELAPTVKQLHGSVKHRGRAPHRFGEKRARMEELTRLKAELQTAIKSEDFETAVTLRDKIRAIEAEG